VRSGLYDCSGYLNFCRIGPFILWPSPFHSPTWHIMHAMSLYSCPTLATPWTVANQALLSIVFSRQEHWSGLPCPPPGDLPNPGIEPRSPVLQTDCLPSEPPGKPMNTGVDSLSHFLGTVSTQESNWGLLQYRWIFYQLSYRGSPRS